MGTKVLKFFVSLVLVLVLVEAKPKKAVCGYASCTATPSNKLNIHLVPHTHDDVGWLKTPDQYYYGSKTNIQFAGVQYILDSVIAALNANSERKFIYVESEFFFKWWDEQTEEVQSNVRDLVNEGRLEFIGGAWSMNDEATTHYQSIIDQFTLGLKRLDENFGKCGRPRVGWQIDPFGHSREMASLFAQMGYDGEFFARLDWVERDDRLTNKTAEMIWQGSDNLGHSSDLFTGVLYNFYSSPPGFGFDVQDGDDPIIDGDSYDNNVDDRVNAFINYVTGFSKYYRTNNLMVPMGSDFNYQDAFINFKNMDKLIKYVNARPNSNVNVFYSTPSCYLKSVHEAKITWPAKKQDFFPYSSDQHSYWSGYFTSRPAVKRFERDGNHFLQVSKQLAVLANLSYKSAKTGLDGLRNVMGVMQHHDAITGTEKQAVAFDYDELLYAAIIGAEPSTKKALEALTGFKNAEFQSCLSLNISSCTVSETMESFMITVYNPLSQSTDQIVRVPVSAGVYQVKDDNGKVIPSQIVKISEGVLDLAYRTNTSQYELVIPVNVPKLQTLYVTRNGISTAPLSPPTVPIPTTVSNDKVKLVFGTNGYLTSVTANNVTQNIKQEFLYYVGASANNMNANNRSSGAYVFRPNSTALPISSSVNITVYEGDFVTEVHQKVSDWMSQVIRLYKGQSYVEFEWLVGPIPVDDGLGKEIISRYSSGIQSAGVFFTDSNGREMLRRERNKRVDFTPDMDENISGNYYPLTAKIALQDNQTRMAVLIDRAEGGSSLADGALELMLHRRLLHDDAFGVGEALNEQAFGEGLVVRGKHYLMLAPSSPAAEYAERMQQLVALLPNWKFFSTPDNKVAIKAHVPDLSYLPENINLLTLEPWQKAQVLIRFENIMEMGVGNSSTFSLKPIFDYLSGVSIREASLGANMWLSDMDRLQFSLDGDVVSQERAPFDYPPFSATLADAVSAFTVTLSPMRIRTFIVTTK